MPKTIQDAQKDKIREQHCEDAEQKLLDILNDSELGLKELVWVVGRMLIDLGASLEGTTDKPISLEQAFKIYTENPTIGNAMVSSGADMHRWLDILD